MALMALFLFSSSSVASKRPVAGIWLNRLAVFNQVSLLVCSYHLVYFTDYVYRDIHNIMGYSFLVTVCVFIVVNLLFLVLELVLSLIKIVKKFCPDFYMKIILALSWMGWLFRKTILCTRRVLKKAGICIPRSKAHYERKSWCPEFGKFSIIPQRPKLVLLD